MIRYINPNLELKEKVHVHEDSQETDYIDPVEKTSQFGQKTFVDNRTKNVDIDKNFSEVTMDVAEVQFSEEVYDQYSFASDSSSSA